MSMRLDRLARLLDTHGADPARWPEAEAGAAHALLAASAEARALRESAALLDAALRESLPPADPAALARIRRAVAVAVAREPSPRPAGLGAGPAWIPQWAGGIGGTGFPAGAGLLRWLRPVLPAGCGALVALAACAVWLSWAPPGSAVTEEAWGAPRLLAMMETTE